MTLIAGYILSDTVQIIADSAVTYSQDIEPIESDSFEYNSNGEIIEFSKSKIVRENAQKIYSINDSMIGTYAGDVREGESIIENIRSHFSYYPDKTKSELLNSFFSQTQPKLTEFIFGFFEDEKPTLFHYNNTGIYCRQTKDAFIIMGSGGRDGRLTMPFLFANYHIWNGGYSPDYSLTALIAVLQCCSINFGTFKEGVGGFFNGAYINQEGVNWCKDTFNILHSNKQPENGERFIIKRLNRDCAVCTISAKNGTQFYLPKLIWLNQSLKDWKEKWLDFDNKNLIEFTSEYYVFICYDRLNITMIKSDHPNLTDYFTITVLEDGNYSITFTEEMVKNLSRIAVNPETGKEDDSGFGIILNLI